MVARRAHNPKVVGSSPAPATTKPEIEKFRAFLLTVGKSVGKFRFTDTENIEI